MPIVVIRVSKNVQSELLVLEKVGFQYDQLANFIYPEIAQLPKKQTITKECLKGLFSLA